MASSDHQPCPNENAVPQNQRRAHQLRQERSGALKNPIEGYNWTDLIGQKDYRVVFKGVTRASVETYGSSDS